MERFRGGMRVVSATGSRVPPVTTPLITLTVSSDAVALDAAKFLQWWIEPLHYPRSVVEAVYQAGTSGSPCGTAVAFEVPNETVYFWTREPHSVLQALSRAGFPVDTSRNSAIPRRDGFGW
jgi:hypothetical protein